MGFGRQALIAENIFVSLLAPFIECVPYQNARHFGFEDNASMMIRFSAELPLVVYL
jgi:hypothetical protein